MKQILNCVILLFWEINNEPHQKIHIRARLFSRHYIPTKNLWVVMSYQSLLFTRHESFTKGISNKVQWCCGNIVQFENNFSRFWGMGQNQIASKSTVQTLITESLFNTFFNVSGSNDVLETNTLWEKFYDQNNNQILMILYKVQSFLYSSRRKILTICNSI